jgi:hypothetical protein
MFSTAKSLTLYTSSFPGRTWECHQKALPYANINMRQSLINCIPCQRQGTSINLVKIVLVFWPIFGKLTKALTYLTHFYLVLLD